MSIPKPKANALNAGSNEFEKGEQIELAEGGQRPKSPQSPIIAVAVFALVAVAIFALVVGAGCFVVLVFMKDLRRGGESRGRARLP